MSKIADFLRAGCEVTILFADLHAYLDNMKAPWELLALRTKYYEACIKGMLSSIGVPLDKLKFVQGTTFQLSREYTLDMYKLTSLVSERNARKAGAEVVKQVTSPALSGLLYPLLQGLDEEYLGVDAQFGGVDQRKIFTFATEQLPRIGYKKRIHLMNPMVPGLTGDKMSSSEVNSKIDLLDNPKSVKKKISGAFCEEGNIEKNGVLTFAKMCIFPLLQKDEVFTIERNPKWGTNSDYSTYEELEKAFAASEVHPGDLKGAVSKCLSKLLAPIQKTFNQPEMVELACKAYPNSAFAQSKRPKQAKKGKAKKGNAPVDPARLNIRVGVIKSIKPHPEAESLFVEEVDCGEAEPITVVSGLAKYYKAEDLLGRKVTLLRNMKPSKLRGIVSNAMLLAASSADGSTVELIDPPAEAKVGERVQFEGFEVAADAETGRANDKVIKKLFAAADMKTNDSLQAAWKDIVYMTSAGPCTVKSLKDASIH